MAGFLLQLSNLSLCMETKCYSQLTMLIILRAYSKFLQCVCVDLKSSCLISCYVHFSFIDKYSACMVTPIIILWLGIVSMVTCAPACMHPIPNENTLLHSMYIRVCVTSSFILYILYVYTFESILYAGYFPALQSLSISNNCISDVSFYDRYVL